MPTLTADDANLLLDGRPYQLISGSICYFRIFPDQWGDRLAKLVALGANAVEVYVPWNFHELRPGEWDFSGRADLAGFLQLAAEAGLLVILRPGPFICAEWTMGGLPWWLLAEEPPPKLRCSDPRFMEAVRAYMQRLAKEVMPLLCSRGGPIVAVQVENEYGYWGADPMYLTQLRDLFRAVLGPEPLLLTVDGCYTPETQRLGGVEGALRTASFGSNAAQRFQALREAQPLGPPVCMEFWVGWFSTWGGGAKVERAATAVARELADMLALGASVNIFVFAGGTSFGFTAGANLDAASGRLEPHVSSYDYDGLLTESGILTEKFHECRKAIMAHTGKVTMLPAALTARPVPLRPRAMRLHQSAPLLAGAAALAAGSRSSVGPLPIEALGEDLGYVLYRHVGTGGGAADALEAVAGLPLKLQGVRDFALVLCDGRPLGVWDRSAPPPDLELPAGVTSLEVLVEITARVNFGPGVAERKGLVGRVAAGLRPQDERELFGWESLALPMRAEQLARLPWRSGTGGHTCGPCFYRGVLDLTDEGVQGDTWLRLPGLRRGFAAVNGFNLGWHRAKGPQLSLYVPSALLRPGENEVVVFELLGLHNLPEGPVALFEEEPLWHHDRAQLLSCQVREVWGFARQVGLRRLVRLGRTELRCRLPSRAAAAFALLIAVLFFALLITGWHERAPKALTAPTPRGGVQS